MNTPRPQNPAPIPGSRHPAIRRRPLPLPLLLGAWAFAGVASLAPAQTPPPTEPTLPQDAEATATTPDWLLAQSAAPAPLTPEFSSLELAAAALPDPEALGEQVDADVDREAAEQAAIQTTLASQTSAIENPTAFDNEAAILELDPADEELEAVEAPPARAGRGFLSFNNFNEVPFWFDAANAFDQPYTGGLFSFVPPLATRQAGPFRYGGGLTAGVAATDNIYASNRNRQADAIWTVTPSIYIEAGRRAKVRLLYAPTLQAYTRNSSQTTVNQTLLLTHEFPFQRLRIGGGFGYLTRRGIFAEADGIASQSSYNANIYAAYPLTRKTSARIDSGISLTDSDPGGTAVENVVTLSLDHQLTTRTTVGTYVGAGLVDGGGDQQTFLTAGVNATQVVSDRVRLFGSVGAQFRQLSSSGDDLISPVANLGAVWSPTDRITISGGAFRDLQNNPFSPSQTLVRTGGYLGSAIVIAPRLTLGLNGSLSYLEQISDRDEDDAEYLFAFGEISLTYQLNSWSSLRGFYSHALRAPVTNAEAFNQNTIGLSVAVTF